MLKEMIELRRVRSFSKVFLPLSVSFFVYSFGWGLVSPIFSIYVNDITGSAFLTGAILSITTLFGIFLNVPFGIIEDRLDMKKVLQAVLAAYFVLALLYPMAKDVPSLVAISVLRGLASSLLWLTSWTYMFYYAQKKAKGRETALFSGMNDLASAVSPLLGGLLSAAFFLMPFYFLGAASLLSLAIVTFFLDSSPKIERAPLKAQLEAVMSYARRAEFLKTVYLVVVFYALINVFYSFVSILLQSEGLSVFQIGLLLTVSLLPTAALEVWIGEFIDRHGVRKTLSAASVLALALGVALPLSGSLLLIVPVILLFTLAYTTIFIALYARMADITKKEGIVMIGAMASIKDLGYTIGPLLAGVVAGAAGLQAAFVLAGVGYAALLPVAITLKD
jgi:DHA1 family multidrug resistance protein-like MFS transporter